MADTPTDDDDDGTLELRVAEFRTQAARAVLAGPPADDEDEGDLVPFTRRRARRIKLNSLDDIGHEMRRVYLQIARDEIAPLEGGRQIRSLRALAETLEGADIDRRLDGIVEALKRNGMMK